MQFLRPKHEPSLIEPIQPAEGLQRRLAENEPFEEPLKEDRPLLHARKEARPNFVLIALAASFVLFGLVAVPRLARMSSADASPTEVARYIDPRLAEIKGDPAAEAAFTDFIKLAKYPFGPVRMIGSRGLRQVREAAKFVDIDPMELSVLDGMFVDPSFGNLLTALESPRIQVIGRSTEEIQFMNAVPGFLRSVARYQLLKGQQADAQRTLTVLFTLYPKVESTPGSDTPILGYTAARESVTATRELRSLNLSASQMQQILDEMQPPKAFLLEDQQIRSRIHHELVEDLTDSASRQRTLVDQFQKAGATFSATETMESASKLALESIENLHKPWYAQSRVRAKELDEDLRELRMRSRSWFEGIIPNARLNSNTAGISLLGAHRYALVGVVDSAFYHLAEYEAARTILGIAIYQKRHHRLPDDLEALVANGILKQLPTDPYSGQPFRYKREGTVYSVGPDRVDGLGTGAVDEFDSSVGGDFVFSIYGGVD